MMNNCCVKCFKDHVMVGFMYVFTEVGNCNFCESIDVKLCNLNNLDNKVGEYISSLIDLYEVCEEGDSGKLIKHVLHEDWDIFNLELDAIQNLIANKSVINKINNVDLLTKKVRIPQGYDADYMHKHCIVRKNTWESFSRNIKYENRFHHEEYFNRGEFIKFISYLTKSYDKGTVMYRARVSSANEVYGIDKMGAPPKEKRMAGRVNPDGIGVLYLASEEITVLSEVRASAFDFVTIGEFVAKKPLRVVNLSALLSVSPFSYEDSDLLNYAINLNVLKDIAIDVAKPMRRADGPLEYLPTQYIAELIKSAGDYGGEHYDGVEYKSTIAKEGVNLAIFNEKLFECVKTYLIEVEELKYKTNRCPS